MVDPGDGLQAWKELKSKLTKMGAQQILNEHMWLHSPEPLPKQNTQIPLFINEWEKRMRDLETISPGHKVSEADKHTALRLSLIHI